MPERVTGIGLDGSGGATMRVLTVDDVECAAAVAAACGGRVVVPPGDRPEWGPTCRTAHLRDPDGNLVELQSY